MKSELVWEEAGERSFIVVLDAGDEAFSCITEFATRNCLRGSSLTATGAFEKATVGWFDLRARSYKPIEVDEQCEGLSLIGDIAVGDDGKPSLHLHAVLGLQDGTTRGGHFLKGIVRPTLDVTIVETPAHLRRRKQPNLGLVLIQR
jgi:predicted DNA-binding protein with PD1-like motif